MRGCSRSGWINGPWYVDGAMRQTVLRQSVTTTNPYSVSPVRSPPFSALKSVVRNPLPDCASYPLDLPQVQQIMTGVEPDHVLDALLAALGVHTHTLHVFE